MKKWACVVTLGMLCSRGFAQDVYANKLLDDAAAALVTKSIDVELPSLESEIMHIQSLPLFPSQKAEAITRQNQTQFDVPFSLQCYRRENTSALFGLRVFREGKLAFFTYADLYLGKKTYAPWDDTYESTFIPDPKATMKMRISLDEVLVENSTNTYFRGAFQLPIELAEKLVLRLHCSEMGTYSNLPIGCKDSKSYVVDLASFIPDPQPCQHGDVETNEVLNITINF